MLQRLQAGKGWDLALILLVYGTLHFAAVSLGYFFKFTPDNFAVFQPAAGLLLAVLLLTEYRLWPALFAGFLLAEYVGDIFFLPDRVHSLFNSLYRLANIAEALTGALLLRRFVAYRIILFQLRHAVGFVLVSCFVSVPLAATIGAFAQMRLSGQIAYWDAWQNWWAADLLGILIVTPVILMASMASWRPQFTLRWFEFVGLNILSISVILLSLRIFGSDASQFKTLFDLPYVLYPLLVWMALRFHGSVVMLVSLAISIIAIWYTGKGHGPLSMPGRPVEEYLLELRGFLIFTSLFNLSMVAAMNEQRRAQNLVFERERQFFTLMNNLPGMVYRCHNDWNWTMEFVSDGCEALTGYKQGDFIQNRKIAFGDLVHSEDRDKVWNDIQTALGERRSFRLIYRLHDAAGKEKWVWEQGQGIFSQRGEILALEGFITDITEVKEAERALQKIEERYRYFVETSAEGIWCIEFRKPVSTQLSVDRQAEEIYRQAYFVEMNDVYAGQNGFFSVVAAKKASLNDVIPMADVRNWNLQKSFVENKYYIAGKEIYGHDRRGNSLVFSVNIVGMVENGRLIRCWGTQIDITEQRKVEEEQKKLELQVHQLQKLEALGVLTSGIAHDFNNILTGTLGFTELALGKTPEENRVHYYLQQIRKSAERAQDLVKRILTFSRPESGERKVVDMAGLTQEAIEFLDASLSSKVSLDYKSETETATVLADPSQIYQVIINLCTNAAHAMSDGGMITVKLKKISLLHSRVMATATLEPGEYIRMAVTDTGSGMSTEVLGRIFDPFFTTKSQGTGLGLSVVLGIVRNHGGAIDIESKLGAGSTFEVYLPYAEPMRMEDQAQVMLMPPEGHMEKILIVDDEQLVGLYAQEVLVGLNYMPEVFDSPQDAINVLTEKPEIYDLVLTDLNMPKMDGLAFAKVVHELRPDLPIIIMTGHYDDKLLKQNKAIVARVLTKPLTIMGLGTTVFQVLHKAKAGAIS